MADLSVGFIEVKSRNNLNLKHDLINISNISAISEEIDGSCTIYINNPNMIFESETKYSEVRKLLELEEQVIDERYKRGNIKFNKCNEEISK